MCFDRKYVYVFSSTDFSLGVRFRNRKYVKLVVQHGHIKLKHRASTCYCCWSSLKSDWIFKPWSGDVTEYTSILLKPLNSTGWAMEWKSLESKLKFYWCKRNWSVYDILNNRKYRPQWIKEMLQVKSNGRAINQECLRTWWIVTCSSTLHMFCWTLASIGRNEVNQKT